MGDASYVQPSFLGGEVSKLAHGRIDRPDYRTLMNVCLNSLPLETGAWVRRPGTKVLAVSRGGAPARTQSFEFTTAAPYTIEFSDGFLRFFTGSQLAMTNDQRTVTAIDAGFPAQVTTSPAHGWSTGNTVYFNSLGATEPLLHNRPLKITVLSATVFTIADALTGSSINGATLGAFVSGKVTRVLEIASPYVGGIWASLRMIPADVPSQNGTTPGAVLLQKSLVPYVLQVVTQPTGTNFATFSLTPASLKDGPYFDPVPGGTLATPSALTGIITLTLTFNAYDAARAYTIGDYATFGGVNYKSIADGNQGNQPDINPSKWAVTSSSDAIGPSGFQGTDVGRHVRLYSEPAIWAAGTAYVTGNVVAYGGSGLAYTGATYWRAAAASTGVPPGTDTTKWVLFPSGAVWTWGKITGLSLANEIDRALAGSANMGTLTSGGGLAAAFDGVLVQSAAASANHSTVLGSGLFSGALAAEFVGKDWSGAANQVIQQAILYPSSDGLVSKFLLSGGSGSAEITDVTVELRASASAPASPSDGTLLGTGSALDGGPITIVSNDNVTAWKYAWFAVTVYGNKGGVASLTITVAAAEVRFYKPGTGSASVNVQILGDALLYTTAIRTWRLGLYSDTTGYPSSGTYHEGRLWLSGLVGNRLDASRSNDIFNFAPTQPDGTVTAANAIAYTFNAPNVNTILWMEPDQLGIVCGTAAGEWLVQASALNQPLTPTSIQAHRAMKHKCANIEPRRTGLTLCAVQRAKRSVLEFFADVYSGKFGADNLAEEAKHLTVGSVAELAFTQEITPVIWARKDDGSLAGITYRRKTLSSSQRAEIRAWHRHTLGSGRLVEYISAGPSVGGERDALTMVTTDPATSIRHIEVMTDILDEGATLAQAAYVDDAVTPDATSTSAITPAPLGGLTLYGLWPLEGKTVAAWIGGLDCGDYTVANGQITVPYGDGISGGTASGLFTAAFAAGVPLAQMLVGFSYNSDGQIVRPSQPAESGARSGPAFGKKRRNQKYAALVEGTQGLYVGTSFARLMPALFRYDNGVSYRVNEQFSGVHKDTLNDDYSLDGMICWRVTRPYIANIAAIGGFIQTQDE
jgi:hypothetical protein